VACSALRRTHRQAIREHARSVAFVHLAGSAATLASRLSKRSGHFMPVSLLDSQLDALEPLAADEAGVTVDIERSMEDIVRVALSELRSATPA
jgi:carbohydrate kinase (thermoresistant glucokinase family)